MLDLSEKGKRPPPPQKKNKQKKNKTNALSIVYIEGFLMVVKVLHAEFCAYVDLQ